jgi:murein DD-endopeptidase MepM/ murein hydrolase activator NlpD
VSAVRRSLALLALVALAAPSPTLAQTHHHHHAVPTPAPRHHSRIDAKIEAERARLEGIHAKLHQKRAELTGAQLRERALAAQLDETNHTIGAVNRQLGATQGSIRSTQAKLAWNEVQLRGAQATLRRHEDALNRRIVDAYEHGDLGYIDVLLRARSFGDFVERWNDIRYVVKSNETAIRARAADARQVAAIQTALLGTQSQLQTEQQQQQQQRFALDGLAQQRRNLVAAADDQRRAVLAEVVQLDDISEAEEAQLEALIREKQREIEAEYQQRRRAALLSGVQLPPEQGAPGELMWPVSGPITSPFGYRMHPVYHRMILHAGIDIGVPTGTTVAAAAAGTVIVASYQGDCGNMVAIDHHGGLSTMYCHLSQIFVSVGQDVQRGQAIGAAGATGDATGPHVHFQVMQDGHPVDPMQFLK